MGVTIYWASDNNGTNISQPLTHQKSGGDVSNGEETDAQTIWLYHNGDNDLTNCGFYIQQYSGTYEGAASAVDDYNELIAWGDATTANSFGGYLINMNATGSWANGWATYLDKEPTYGFVASSGLGDSQTNFVLLNSAMNTSGEGILDANSPNGYGGNIRFQCKIQVPTDETI